MNSYVFIQNMYMDMDWCKPFPIYWTMNCYNLHEELGPQVMNFYCTMNSPYFRKIYCESVQVRSVFNYLQNSWIGRKLGSLLFCGMIYFHFLNISLGWKRLQEDLIEKSALSSQKPPEDTVAVVVDCGYSQVECSNRFSFTCRSQKLLVRIIIQSTVCVEDCWLWQQGSNSSISEEGKKTHRNGFGKLPGKNYPLSQLFYIILYCTDDTLFIIL